MNKEQQIAEMATFIHGRRDKNGSEKTAKVLFEAGYRKVPKGSFICSADETNLDVEICNNCGMEQADELFERDKENKRLKAENKRTRNMKNVLEIEKGNAVKEFAEKLKTRFEEKEQFYICIYDWDGHSAVVDCANEVDELLKEYEK